MTVGKMPPLVVVTVNTLVLFLLPFGVLAKHSPLQSGSGRMSSNQSNNYISTEASRPHFEPTQDEHPVSTTSLPSNPSLALTYIPSFESDILYSVEDIPTIIPAGISSNDHPTPLPEREPNDTGLLSALADHRSSPARSDHPTTPLLSTVDESSPLDNLHLDSVYVKPVKPLKPFPLLILSSLANLTIAGANVFSSPSELPSAAVKESPSSDLPAKAAGESDNSFSSLDLFVFAPELPSPPLYEPKNPISILDRVPSMETQKDDDYFRAYDKYPGHGIATLYAAFSLHMMDCIGWCQLRLDTGECVADSQCCLEKFGEGPNYISCIKKDGSPYVHEQSLIR